MELEVEVAIKELELEIAKMQERLEGLLQKVPCPKCKGAKFTNHEIYGLIACVDCMDGEILAMSPREMEAEIRKILKDCRKE